MKANIVVLPGDGIGPEVTPEAVRTLEAVATKAGHSFSFTEQLVGGCSIDAHGVALTDGVLAACQSADASCASGMLAPAGGSLTGSIARIPDSRPFTSHQASRRALP